jgi:hypothetical protein
VRTCTADALWFPPLLSCVDIDECDRAFFDGKYFVDCAARHGAESKCINTFGSYVCTPHVTVNDIAPRSLPSSRGSSEYFPASREIVPGNTLGGQIIQFAVRAGSNVAAPYVTRVQYTNPDKALYADSRALLYECTDVKIDVDSIYFLVQCTLSPGQGAGLYVKLQFCVQPNAFANLSVDVDCTRWNWAWSGTQAPGDIAGIDVNSGLRVSYPAHAFIPRSLHAITIAGPGQRTADYVSASSLGETIGLDVNNLFLERQELVNITYGHGITADDFPYQCDFLQAMSLEYSAVSRTIVCHTQDHVDQVDLRFRLELAHRFAYSTDVYSYPQMPTIDTVKGCAVNNATDGSTRGCPTDGGNVWLTITGTGFLEPLSAIVAGRQCSDLVRKSNLEFSCRLPPGSGSTVSIIVKAGTQRAEARDRLSFAAPTVTSIRGCQQASRSSVRECDRLGGNIIQIDGDNFGASGATVSIGGLPCTTVKHSLTDPHRQLTCLTPADSAVDRPVTLLQRHGEISREVLLLSYVQCEPGSHNDNFKCAMCGPGTYNDLRSQQLCKQCAPGTAAPGRGFTTCTPCPPGTFSGLGAQECRACARGSFALGQAEACTQCAPGTYAARERSSRCDSCPLGSEHTPDYSFCQCKVGSYMDALGVCQPCMRGGNCLQAGTSVYNVESLNMYSPSVSFFTQRSVVRVKALVAVGPGRTHETAALEAQALVLKALFDDSPLPRARFVVVSVDAFSTNINQNSSKRVDSRDYLFVTVGDTNQAGYVVAEANSHSTKVLTIDITPAVQANDATAEDLAQQALNALITVPQGSLTAFIDASYTRFAVTSFEPCLSNTCRPHNECIEGHSGPLCSVCLPGYGKTSVFKCARCNDPAIAYMILIAGVLAAIAGCAILAWKQIVDGRESMNELPAPAVPLLFKIVMSGLQVMSIAARYDLRWPGFLGGLFDAADTTAGVGTAIVSLDCFLGDSPAVKPFWVTSVSIMVLPLLGVLLPALFFAPRYCVARRRYKVALLETAVQQRALLVEMTFEHELFVRTRNKQDDARAHDNSRLINGAGQVWANVDDAHELGILAPAQSRLAAVKEERFHAGVDLGAKEVAVASAEFAAGKPNQRRLRIRPLPLPPPTRPPATSEPDTPSGHERCHRRKRHRVVSLFARSNSVTLGPGASTTNVFTPEADVHAAQLARAALTPPRLLGDPALSRSPASRTFLAVSSSGDTSSAARTTPFSYADAELRSASVSKRDDSATDAQALHHCSAALPLHASGEKVVRWACEPIFELSSGSDSGFEDGGTSRSHAASGFNDEVYTVATTLGVKIGSAHTGVLSEPAFTPRPHSAQDAATPASAEGECLTNAHECQHDAALPLSSRLPLLTRDIIVESEVMFDTDKKRDLFAFQRDLLNEARIPEFALASASERAVDSSEVDALDRVAREVELYAEIVRHASAFDATAAIKLIASADTPDECVRTTQSADDLDNMRILATQQFGDLYNAELLRERVVRRERAVQALRVEQQFDWYIATYGEDEGKKAFEGARATRAKAEPVRLTASEMRARMDIAETNYTQTGSEYMGYAITAITVVMFMIHPNIVRQFFMVLSCKNIGGTDDPSASVVLGDMFEPCFSSRHLFFVFVIGIPMFILWVLGIPLFAWFVLYRNRDLITLPSSGVSSVMRSRKRAFEAQMAFLYRGYRPVRYYWFLADMARKAALVAFAVLFPGALHTQLLMASLLIFFCILAQIAARPFENKVPEFVEFFSLATSFMIFFLANFLYVDTLSEGSKVVVAVLISILVVLFLCVAVLSFIVLRREESKLIPLRAALREAHSKGLDTSTIIRAWRIDQANAQRHQERKRAANSVWAFQANVPVAFPHTGSGDSPAKSPHADSVASLFTLTKASDVGYASATRALQTISVDMAASPADFGNLQTAQVASEALPLEAEMAALAAARLNVGSDIEAACHAPDSLSTDIIAGASAIAEHRLQASGVQMILNLE